MIKQYFRPLSALVFAAGVLLAQDQAGVQITQGHADSKGERPESFRPGSSITFDVVLNEALPKGAHFDLRISPVTKDQEVALGSGEPIDGSVKKFRVKGRLPEGAVPGDWHISVIWLFLSGSSWTHSTISHDDVTFRVDGEAYQLPTKAEIKVAH